MLCKDSPSTGPNSPRVVGFYEETTGSVQYVVIDETTHNAVLIDVVQNFDPTSARTSNDCAQEILDFVAKEGLSVVWILDTHPHADHLMASAWLAQQTGAPTAIGERVQDIAELWRDIYDMADAFDLHRNFSRLFADGDSFSIGNLKAEVIFSPGHTLGSITYLIGDAAFVHDTFMHVDFGTARCDFPGGSARTLYRSLQRILKLPNETRVFVGHDYGTDDREDPAWESSVGQQRDHNIHIGGGVTEEEFVSLREERDENLDLPDQMLFALQVNLRGGRLPEPNERGDSFFRIPANKF